MLEQRDVGVVDVAVAIEIGATTVADAIDAEIVVDDLSTVDNGTWIQAIVRTLDDQGINGTELALRAGISPRVLRSFHQVFRCPIHFDAAEDVLEYSRKDVEAPLPNANTELARQSDAIVADYLARTGRIGTLSDRVHALLVRHLPDGGPSEASIAQRLCMSPRNLQLQLAQEKTSYKTLLNGARRDLAETYLRQGKYSIKEIAFLLGFSDAATFTRAFRRWTGCSPRRFAEQSKSDE